MTRSIAYGKLEISFDGVTFHEIKHAEAALEALDAKELVAGLKSPSTVTLQLTCSRDYQNVLSGFIKPAKVREPMPFWARKW